MKHKFTISIFKSNKKNLAYLHLIQKCVEQLKSASLFNLLVVTVYNFITTNVNIKTKH